MRITRILMPNRFWRVMLFLALGYFVTGTYVQAQCGTTTQGLMADRWLSGWNSLAVDFPICPFIIDSSILDD
jgi:hypothetical protein